MPPEARASAAETGRAKHRLYTDLAAALPRAEVRRLDDVGHSGLASHRPDAVVQAVHDVLPRRPNHRNTNDDSGTTTMETTPTEQWSAAAWWVPLLRDLLLLEAANTRTGFLVSRLDLAERPPPVSASTVDGHDVTVHVGPEIGASALRQRLRRAGLALPEPALDNTRLLQTPPAEASAWLVHAWVLDALSNSDAFPGRSPQERPRRVDLRDIRGDTTRVDVTLHLVAHGYGIRMPVLLDDPGNDYSGLEYALTERALALHPEQLEPLEPHHGLTTYLGPTHSATGWETPGHEPHA